MKTTIQNIDNKNMSIKLDGRLDTTNAEQFKEDIMPLLADASKIFTFDFTELTFLSSSGMRYLLHLQKEALKKGGKVCIKGASPEIREILELTGFTQMVEIL